MRAAAEPGLVIDWEAFSPGCTRSDAEKLAAVLDTPAAFTKVEGPWMTRWSEET
jgi:hypothetical protein